VPDSTTPAGSGFGASPGGLVISAITGRGTDDQPKNPGFPGFAPIPDTVPEGLAGWRWPSPELVGAAASSFTRTLPAWDGSEGPRARIEIGPGILRVARRDLNRAEKTAERQTERRLRQAVLDDDDDQLSTRGEISEWSAKSRARMVSTIASLDMREFVDTADQLPAMVTLTLPGDWLTVAPDAPTFKRMLHAFRKRFFRAFGYHIRGLWKLEFQRRGAPHVHIFMRVPFTPARDGRGFVKWLSETWADVVGHPDPEERARHITAGTGVDFNEGLRSTDPRRIAVYFTKHSSANFGDKEYQHVVPAEWREKAGRFWGYWGLEKATTYVEVPMQDSIDAARLLRRWSRAQGTTRQSRVWRSGRWRKVRRRVHRMASSQGFVCVNDGPAMAWQIARYLDLRGQQP
jgi:hypothetical protein